MRKIINEIQNNKLLFIIIVIGSILRFYHLDYQSVWLDEIHTLNEANPSTPFSELYTKIKEGEQMPPLYFYTVYFLFKIFGYTTIVVRVYSALLGAFSLYALYLLGYELYSKRVGLIASFFLSVNYFHLFYSQEARPYSFFMLFSILSFYWLVKFIKRPTYKTSIYYGIFSALMIYGHFFGLFALFSQYIILLLFLLLHNNKQKIDFIKKAIVSALITLILYLPAINILLGISKLTNFWIPAPTNDSFGIIFKEFFGNSEILLSLLLIPIIAYIVSLYKSNVINIDKENILNDKITISFLVLSVWISIVIICPLIRSYLSVPMLISRYFIVILPAVLIIFAIGLAAIKNKIVLYSYCISFSVFSLIDISIVKNFYSGINKTQFREATNFVKENNKKGLPVVSSLGVYMPYFFNKNQTIIDQSLENYISEMQQDSTKIKEFWYIDGHGRNYTKNEQVLAFIDKNFYIENNYNGMDAWTKHFILLKNFSSTVDLSKFNLVGTEGDLFKLNLEFFENNGTTIKATGWAFFEGMESKDTRIELVLIKAGTKNAIKLRTQKVNRPDVTDYFKSEKNLDNSGFTSEINVSDLQSGNYKLGVLLINNQLKKEGIFLTDREINK